MRDALIVFAKVPNAGSVKTRLGSLLTLGEAAELYEAFLQDALNQYARLPVDLRVYVDGPAAEVSIEAASPMQLFSQEGRGLGKRMARAFAESFADGYERLVIIGTDHPTLPDAFIELAFNALDEPLSVCIGPATDGGYYLLGMTDLLPALFRGMAYSHRGVFDQAMEEARKAADHITILPEWYDVDTPEDLRRLRQDLGDPASAGAACTARVMCKLVRKYAAFFEGEDVL